MSTNETTTRCGTCNPETGDQNTLCNACLQRELTGQPAIELAPADRIEDLVASIIPVRFQHVTANDLIPELAALYPHRQNVYISGPAGRGKTHQAAALTRREIDVAVNDGRTVSTSSFQFANVANLVERLRTDQRREGGGRSLVTLLATAHMLVLDDLGAEKPTEWVRERLYDVVNQRYEYRRGTVVTTNLAPDQLARQLGDRIAGRLMDDAAFIQLEGEQRRKPANLNHGAA